jgi:thioredoxin 1
MAATTTSLPKTNVLTIDDETFDQEVLGAHEPVLVDFTATWCGPCKMLAPIVERIADENAGRIKVGKIDIDESPNVAARLGIRGAPTLVVFKHGKEAARHVGATSKEKILALLER